MTLVNAAPVAANEDISLPGAPSTAAACIDAWQKAESPEAAAAVFVGAMLAHETDPETALGCFAGIVDDGYLANSELSYDFKYLIEVGIDRNPEIARSYVRGATPQNAYALPEAPWTLEFTRDDRYQIADDEFRVKILTSGQPTARPITLRLDGNGHYRVNEASTLFVGVFAPAASQ
jgi:hypothetical protein